ncbi:hypothetical protein GCM10023156_15420 [Novipirellula rosea]|uniref:Uncharacterized protein n=1 Tax=Novipirellula rosea TaxID=1031540 RepID=A0ABP8MJE1_9BACT
MQRHCVCDLKAVGREITIFEQMNDKVVLESSDGKDRSRQQEAAEKASPV